MAKHKAKTVSAPVDASDKAGPTGDVTSKPSTTKREPSAAAAVATPIKGGGDADDLVLDPELESHVRPLTPEERKGLEEAIKTAGKVRDPIIVWNGQRIVVDGHNRLRIARGCGATFTVEEMKFPDRNSVKEWMIQNQLAKRNLSPELMKYYRGHMYRSQTRQGKRNDLEGGQNAQKSTTAQQLAERYKVDEKTIRPDADLARVVDTLAELHGPEVRAKILSRAVKVTQAQLDQIAKEPPSEQVPLIKHLLEHGEMKKEQRPKPSPVDSLEKSWKKLKSDGERKDFLTRLLADEAAARLIRSLQPGVGGAEEPGAGPADGHGGEDDDASLA